MAYISDHAVLRYLERAYGLDIETVRSELASPALECAERFGASVVIGRGGVRIILRDGTVTTVLPRRFFPRPTVFAEVV